MIVQEAGIYALVPEIYHADPAPDPSLSASAAERLISESARHCWTFHPRLNPLWEDMNERENSSSQKRMAMEHGSALHTMVLGVGRAVMEVPADSYQSAKAKEVREIAYDEGYIPVLAGDIPRLKACADAARAQIATHPDLKHVLGGPGRAEQTLLWRERIGSPRAKKVGGWLWCRAMVDFLPDNPREALVDLKFTKRSAEPLSYGATVRDTLTLRSAHYLRGAQTLRNATPRAYWIVAIEVDPPFGLSVHRADNTLLHQAREKWMEAASRFHSCLTLGRDAEHWPFWQAGINVVGMKPWQQAEWEDRKAMEGIPEQRGAGISVRRAHQLIQQIGGPVS